MGTAVKPTLRPRTPTRTPIRYTIVDVASHVSKSSHRSSGQSQSSTNGSSQTRPSAAGTSQSVASPRSRSSTSGSPVLGTAELFADYSSTDVFAFDPPELSSTYVAPQTGWQQSIAQWRTEIPPYNGIHSRQTSARLEDIDEGSDSDIPPLYAELPQVKANLFAAQRAQQTPERALATWYQWCTQKLVTGPWQAVRSGFTRLMTWLQAQLSS